VSDGAALKALLDEVRRLDYCMALEEHELAIQAVAVPLRNMRGRTVAALNVVTSAKRMSPQTMQQEILPLLQEAARTLRPSFDAINSEAYCACPLISDTNI
jgi:IclR family pca regulon transcriptional regulator